MGIVFIDGFDLYNGIGTNTGMQAFWSLSNGFYSPFMVTGRFGGQAFAFGNEAAAMYRSFGATSTAFTVAHAFRCASPLSVSAATNARAAVLLCTNGGASNYQLGWRPNPDGSIGVWRMTSATAGTLLGTTATGIIGNNVWHWIDFSGTLHATTGTINLKVDGSTVLNLSNQNTLGFVTTPNVDGVIIGSQGGTLSNGIQFAYDDLYVLDTTTTLGERRIETLRPSADTANKDWTADTGTVNFSRVNEATVNAATFVQASTVGALDLYDLSDLSSLPATIDAVNYVAFAQKTDATARQISMIGDVGGTQQETSNFTLAGSVTKYSQLVLTAPDGGAWNGPKVNQLKAGPKVKL